VDLYSASSQTVSTALPLHAYFGADLRSASSQPDTRQHWQTTDTGYCITLCVCLLFQLWLGTQCAYPRRGGSAWVDLDV